MPKMMLVTWLMFTAGAVNPAFGQEQLFRSMKATAGTQVRLGLIGNVTRECTPGPMPEVKVVTPPKNGTLAVRSGKSKAGSLKRCPDLEVSVQGVFYQANPNFSGTDEVVYEVKRPDGKTQTINTRIEVGTRQAPGPKPRDTEDL